MTQPTRLRYPRCVCGHEPRFHHRSYAAGGYMYLMCRAAPCACLRYVMRNNQAPRNPKLQRKGKA